MLAVIRAIRNRMPDFPLTGDPRDKKSELSMLKESIKES